MGLVQVGDYSDAGWAAPERADDAARAYCRRLEEGDILCFPRAPFALPDDDRAFLLGARQRNTAHHKNISYKPGRDRVSGLARGGADLAGLRTVMRSYSQAVSEFLRRFLSPYAGQWRLDFASFRAIEEQRRNLPESKRNDLLHVDSFPTRPSNGDRILRVFTNLNPEQPRVWLTGEPFDATVSNYGGKRVKAIAARAHSPWRRYYRLAMRLGRAVGLPVVDRPLYDEFMLGFHHDMKNDADLQQKSAKSRWEFPPNSTWLVFTDLVPHAVLAGRFALEQTFIVSRSAMLLPEKAPWRVLQKFAGVPVTD